MNLLTEHWLQATVSGQIEQIPVSQICDSNVTDLAFTRPDLNGAMYQFLIGLLQTAFAPDDVEQWADCYEQAPSPEQLQQAFEPYLLAFELLPKEGAAFLQDFDQLEGETKSISALFIESPGGKTIKDNTDHFVKGGTITKVCPSCTAAALYCMQSAAPSGGVGHRTSMRGGGGLTTLVLPALGSTLWQKLWLNVLPKDVLTEQEHTALPDIFPWLKPTKTSEGNVQLFTAEANPLQMHWGMPRRFQLETEGVTEGECDVCGRHSEQLLTQFVTKNYGINYAETWQHDLTPYKHDAKGNKPALSIKGQKGGNCYKDWLGLTIGSADNTEKPAKSVAHFFDRKMHEVGLKNKYVIWCFAYDMDNMKARNWYEHQLPIFHLPENDIESIRNHLNEYIGLAKECLTLLKRAVKEALLGENHDAKSGFTGIEASFWHNTEPAFYQMLGKLQDSGNVATQLHLEDDSWPRQLRKKMENLFDETVMQRFGGECDMQRIANAKAKLMKSFYGLKNYKTTNKRYQALANEFPSQAPENKRRGQ